MKILYLFPHEKEGELQDVLKGLLPTDRLYGVVELQKRGYDVQFNDGRFRANSASLSSP